MSYHTENVKVTPTLKTIVKFVDIGNIDRLPCPYCNGQMMRVDNGNYPHEEYKPDGDFERTERYYCDNCCTWADVTQTYTPTDRRMKVMRDVFDD